MLGWLSASIAILHSVDVVVLSELLQQNCLLILSVP